VKRARLKAKRTKLLNPIDHPDGACGNAGCKKCNKTLTKTLQ